MKPILKNVLAVIVGIFVGSAVNLVIFSAGHAVIPLPEGADVSTTEGFRESIKQFTPIHFLTPFLAHALGTLAGAFLAAKIAASHNGKLAMAIGVLFLIGGIAAVAMFGGPIWFAIVDLVFAYLPMAWLGARLARNR